ncbi:hypothetical protein N7510_007414 [Penicillium lagena]|uniref:uncharacterized protein n=1 Tax=Penicillium lagena TaxID=94218 RepID=UPI00253F87D6|nr:uncharacterized protein N7510_007414 [Penicillium lagena]KAJ5610695.1 hypothetical protein N7510_007414 [Penicillium lagena]
MAPITITQWTGWAMLLWLSLVSSLLYWMVTLLKGPKSSPRISPKDSSVDSEPKAYPSVEALPEFEWQQKEPLKIRPFRPKYNLTMSIEETTVNGLIEMDKTYVDRIHLRRKIMNEHTDTVLAAEDSVKSAVDEFYCWLLGSFLPTRFPRMFVLQHINKEGFLHNLVMDEKLPLSPAEKPLETLERLGGLVDDDFLFLLPSDDGDGYTLKGFVTCFPNGFNTFKKLNLKLKDIHKPVPQYKERLEKSMDRYFTRLPIGKFVKRANWAITTTDELFTPSGTHIYEGEKVLQEEIDISSTRLRCERQVLHRLPQSRALLFSFKTLTYTLAEIKEEGLGKDLAEAIDGLKEGNAPDFHFYKRAAVWGESVKAFLTS